MSLSEEDFQPDISDLPPTAEDALAHALPNVTQKSCATSQTGGNG